MDEYDIYSHSNSSDYTAPIPEPYDDNSVSFGPAPSDIGAGYGSGSASSQPYLINNRPIHGAGMPFPPPAGAYPPPPPPPPTGAYPPPPYPPQYGQPYMPANPYAVPVDPGKGNVTASIICSAICILSVRTGLLSLCVGIVALVLAIISRNKTRAAGLPLRTESTAALVCAIIGVVLSGIVSTFFILIFTLGFNQGFFL